MLSMNFEEALSRIVMELPKQRRTFLFSATMTSSVAKLERASLKDPVKVRWEKKCENEINFTRCEITGECFEQ
jgi:ATP-dependent RNA helicase DDX47/RRP3